MNIQTPISELLREPNIRYVRMISTRPNSVKESERTFINLNDQRIGYFDDPNDAEFVS